MPQAVEDCVESVLQEEDATESEAYAVCWSRYNEGEIKEDDDYEWGPYTDEDEEDIEGEDSEEKDVKNNKDIAEKIYEEYDVDKNVAKVIAHVITASEKGGVQDTKAVKSVALRTVTGNWKSIHPSENTKEGRHHLRETYKYLVDKILGQGEVAKTLSKSQTMQKVDFTAEFGGSQTVFKAGDEFIIWGPASVEVVDKEGDRIHTEALEDALPQLLKRGRLSLEHSDQLVGEIMESFELEEPVEIDVNGNTIQRKEFPTDVLNLKGQKPALYVCGKIYDDTRQSKRVRESIEDGELNSYSISGEALVSRSKIEDGEPVNDIVEMDLSAVTVCEEGMNQHANFATVKKDSDDDKNLKSNILTVKSDEGRSISIRDDDSDDSDEYSNGHVITVTKSSGTSMSDEDTSEETQELTLGELKSEFEGVVKDALSEEDFAQEDDILGKDDVENIVEQKMEDIQSSDDDVEKEDEESESLTEEDVRSIVKETLDDEDDEDEDLLKDDPTEEELREFVQSVIKEEDEEEDEEEEKQGRPPEDEDEEDEEEKGEYEDDEEMEDEEEKDVEDGKQVDEDELAEMVADLADVGVDEAAQAIDSLKMAQNDDDDMEDDEEEKGEYEDDEEMEDEEEKGEDEEEEDEEEKGDGSSQYTVTELQEKLPEDVFDAVRGYIGEEKDVEETEKQDDDILSDLDVDDAVEKAIEEQFNITESPDAPNSDVEKSYEEEGDSEEQNPALSLWD